jgi:hypothetical protein
MTSTILVFSDPSIQEKQCAAHCRMLANKFDGLFFHKDNSSWNTNYAAVVRMIRRVLQNDVYMSNIPWHSIMSLQWTADGVGQLHKHFDVLYQREIPDETVSLLLEDFERIGPRNGDPVCQHEFENMVVQRCGLTRAAARAVPSCV